MSTSTLSEGNPRLTILQLNCFNKHDTTQELLQLGNVDILLLQEPWTNPFNYSIPHHQMWHGITPYDHNPKDLQTKYRTCIYVAKKHPIQNISILPSGNTFITALELKTGDQEIPRLRVMSFYNRPSTNEGLPLLKIWFDHNSDRHTPMILGMDANLHHNQWNPAARSTVHPASRDLIRICGTAGFKVISEKGVPTFYPRRNGSPSTIDLTWGNWALTKHKLYSKTLTQTFGSDHQALRIQIPQATPLEVPTRNTASLKHLDRATYHMAVETALTNMSSIFNTDDQAISGINQLTDVLTDAFYAQGKTVK